MTNSDVLLRDASNNDGDGIADVIRQVFAQYPNCPFDRAAEFSELDQIETYLSKRGGKMWVAERDGRIVGCFGIIETPSQAIFELYKVYLLPEARGQGTAKKLLDMAFDFARQRGGRTVRLWTDTRFYEGHAFYRKNGFEKLPITRYHADLGHTWEFAFERSLFDEEMSRSQRDMNQLEDRHSPAPDIRQRGDGHS